MNKNFHMIEFIHESPDSVTRTLANNETAIHSILTYFKQQDLQRIVVLSVGSSYAASIISAPLFRTYCTIPTHILPASEYTSLGVRLIDEQTLVIVVSRSGERGMVIDALKYAIGRGAYSVAMTGASESLLAQTAQMVLLTGEGPEITFPKTKSVTACASLLMRLALAFALPNDSEAAKHLEVLRAAPEAIEKTIVAVEPQVKKLIGDIQNLTQVLIGGTCSNYGAAIEGAGKIQETTDIPSQGEHLCNAFYGPLGAINKKWLVVPLLTSVDLLLGKQLLKMVRRFSAHSMVISEPGLDIGGLSDYILEVPVCMDPLLAGLIFLPPLQLLTYYWTIAKGMNPDEPTTMHSMLDALLAPGRQEPELRSR
jgi:glucosamine--fructose-6-phosphate aminotransferase (isomerizing)